VAEPLDVRTNVQIQSVTRSADGVTVEAEMPYAVGNDIEHRPTTLNYDWLVLCCPLR
jgi:hypothetical protein